MSDSKLETATFAGGRFWAMVLPFSELPGVIDVTVGYCANREVVQLTFDPTIFPYEKLVDIYWRNIDPTDESGQFHDRGERYQTAIYVHNDRQRTTAEVSKQQLIVSKKFAKPIVTEILAAERFEKAEEKQQQYHKKFPFH